ncbi:MAG: hypothetical protein NWR73_09885 [Flavobacteriales bacterium]|nr:hypothetical protein [Flavobacteriales bacterium]
MNEEENILDLPEDDEKPLKSYPMLRGLALLGIITALVFRLQHWPYQQIIMLVSLALWFVWSLLHFLAQYKQVRNEKWYFMGRTLLLVGLLFSYFKIYGVSNTFFILALILITIGFSRAK